MAHDLIGTCRRKELAEDDRKEVRAALASFTAASVELWFLETRLKKSQAE
jgi:hypothetical protein